MPIINNEKQDRIRVNFNGTGDILIFTASWKDEEPAHMLAFAEGEHANIGKEFEGDKEEIEEKILLEFNKPETVDILLNKLKQIKENLQEDVIKYDYRGS
jgi:hypothetical protein